MDVYLFLFINVFIYYIYYGNLILKYHLFDKEIYVFQDFLAFPLILCNELHFLHSNALSFLN